ncbi:MAG: hypothetical protein V2A53_02115 [bacterium]
MKRFLFGILGLGMVLVSPAYSELTKQDIEEIRKIVKEENNNLRQEMKAEIGGLRQETKAEIGGLRQEMNARMDDTNRRIDDMKDFMFWGFGLLLTGMITLVGFVLWDRRSALQPAVTRLEALKVRENAVEEALRIFGRKEPAMLGALKQVGL